MLFRFASDLHMNCYLDSDATVDDVSVFMETAFPELDTDKETVLILAGDITECTSQRQILKQVCKARFLKTIYVPGNHDLCGMSPKLWDEMYAPQEEDAFVYTSAQSARLVSLGGGISVICAPLWAKYGGHDPKAPFHFGGWYDMRKIVPSSPPSEDEALSEAVRLELLELHLRQKNQIRNVVRMLPEPEKILVVTHFVPSMTLTNPKYPPSVIDEAFRSDTLHDVAHPNIKAWIYGHDHYRVDRVLEGIRVLSNPFGYPSEQLSYNPTQILEIK